MLKPRSKQENFSEHTNIKTLPLEECLAKTKKLPDGTIIKGTDVFTHCYLTGLVAKELIKRQPIWLQRLLYPEGSDLLAAIHDIGKIFPSFQITIHNNLTRTLANDRACHINAPVLKIRHEAVSQVATSDFGKYIPEIIGRHHGLSSLQTGLPNDEIFGGSKWQELRLELIDALKKHLHSDLPQIASAVHADFISGFVCISDWISSGLSIKIPDRVNITNESVLSDKIRYALDNAGFLVPQVRNDLTFEDIFGFHPYNIQTKLKQVANTPGVYVLEAPMGLGKTEAALYAAYTALAEGRATGIYFALPTQLTSNKIYDRMNSFLSRILDESSPNSKALLLHSSAWLVKTEIGEEGIPGKSWFNSSKRGLLAPFAVGTIDQALMAAMNVKHGFVRTFGLAGKVVILDEVHCYDSYTGTILDTLISVLKKIGCTVIILSATLTAKRRSELLKINISSSDSKYPLISSSNDQNPYKEYAIDNHDSSKVYLSLSSDDQFALDLALSKAESGQQVLWIENTVNEAQGLYKRLGARARECKIECGLLHSRFTKIERDENENKWVDIYGKKGMDKRQSTGRILVGTQVLEQSLDIDADFLITRISPTDMLFQRIGRLWRHRQNDPLRPADAKREVLILSPDITDASEKIDAFGKTGYVYAPYVLCRTLQIWKDLKEVTLPDQIQELMSATYSDRSESGLLLEHLNVMITLRDKLRRFANIGISHDGKTLPEIKAQTRYSEIETIDVLLIRSRQTVKDGSIQLQLLNGSYLTLPTVSDISSTLHRSIAAEIMTNTVTVPEKIAPETGLSQLKWFENFVYIGNEEEMPFRVAIVQKDSVLKGIGGEDLHNKFRLLYSSELGYMALEK